MSDLILWILFAVFLLKCIDNAIIPFRIFIPKLYGDSDGVSLLPFVEVILLIVMLIVSYLAGSDGLFSFSRLLLSGICMIVGSYMLCIGNVYGLRFLVSRFRHEETEVGND